MKHFFKIIPFLFLPLFAQSQTQYTIDYEVVCWDSAGVTVPLLKKIYEVVGMGSLHGYYTLSTLTKVVPTVGTVGACDQVDSLTFRLDTIIAQLEVNLSDNDTVIVRLDSLLTLFDSLIGVNTEPQQCECVYVLDLQNHVYSIAQNAQKPVWSYERVVTRNCGAGDEEIFRQAGSQMVTGKASTYYTANAGNLSNGGVIDSLKVYFKNPDTVAWIYLSPAAVAANYPLLMPDIDTNDLRFNTATVADMNAAIEEVMAYALGRVALTHNPVLNYPTNDFSAEVNSSGAIVMRFYVYNDPVGFYAGINHTAGSRRMDYHQTASGVLRQSNGAGVGGINQTIAGYYNLPCDTTIQTSYTGTIVQSASVNYYTLPVETPAAPSLAGSLGTGTCTQACPEMPDCFEICNTADNPIPVQIVPSVSDSCFVQNLVEFPVTASGNSVSLAANTYHSVSIAVTSGTVSISLVNSGSGITTATFSSGQTFSARAKECALLPTGFGINATSGSAIVSTIR